jgi:hypothetical protein
MCHWCKRQSQLVALKVVKVQLQEALDIVKLYLRPYQALLEEILCQQSQSIFTIKQSELNRKRFDRELPALNTLAESSTQQTEWQFGALPRVNAKGCKVFQTITP